MTPIDTTARKARGLGRGLRYADVRRDHLLNALRKNRGNVSATARRLDCHRTTIRRAIKRYGITPALVPGLGRPHISRLVRRDTLIAALNRARGDVTTVGREFRRSPWQVMRLIRDYGVTPDLIPGLGRRGPRPRVGRDELIAALRETGADASAAAPRLKVSPRGVSRLIRAYGVKPTEVPGLVKYRMGPPIERDRLLQVLREADGSIPSAALVLGYSRRQTKRFVIEYGITSTEVPNLDDRAPARKAGPANAEETPGIRADE